MQHVSCPVADLGRTEGHKPTESVYSRLVEALESYEPANEGLDPMMDTYASESVRSQLLGGGKQHRRVRLSGTMATALMSAYLKASLYRAVK